MSVVNTNDQDAKKLTEMNRSELASTFIRWNETFEKLELSSR